MEDYTLDIEHIVRGLWRYRWTAIIGAWLIGLLGTFFVATQEDRYEATARVYVDTASQLRRLLDDQIVESNFEQQLRYVREAMLGGPQLERVATELGLVGADYTSAEVAQVVASLQYGIEIISSSDSGAFRAFNERTDDTYLIRYIHRDRQTAINVVDKLLSTFVEDTLGAKQTSSQAAASFLSRQIEEYQGRLQAAEAALADFNRRNYDRLPSLQGGYFQSLQDAREATDETSRTLTQARSRLASVERQMRGEAPHLTPGGQLDPNSVEARIQEAERNLYELKLRFTDQHPDVVAATELLNSYRTQLEEVYAGGVDLDAPSNNPVFQALQISRNEILAEIATLTAELRQSEQKVDELQSLIGEMPEVEAELARLNRDYEIIQTRYQSLQESLERERLSREVVESEEFEFRIIEPPAAGLQPVAPRRTLLHLIVLVGSIGFGLGLAYLRTLVTPVIDTIQGIKSITDFPLIGMISMVGDEAEFPTVGSLVAVALPIFFLAALVMAMAFIKLPPL